MTIARKSIQCSPLPMLALLFVVPLACPDLSRATDLKIYGSLGGNTFRAECPKGSYLVGLAGRAGSWVNRIAPICAPWLRGTQTLGVPSIGQSFGMSTGGEERQANCMSRGSGANRHAIQSWWIRLLRSDDHYVQSIQVFCASLTAPVTASSGGRLDFGTYLPPADAEELVSTGPFPPQLPFQSCPSGEVAVGIGVRAGQFVDAVGLICGPVPSGAPATKVDPRVVRPGMPTPDMFVIIKPYAGDTVVHGQLFIFAAPPKVGSTDVVELELRYLDAPPNQQNSYPYTTIFSITKVQLLDGYLVSDRVTGGYVGRWQVRARSSMRTPPGPWSIPVQFNMVRPQVPPPMVEMPKPNAPILQAPAPNSSMTPASPQSGGATTQMRRSPSIIMPRGAEDKETGSETAGTPPESDKRP